MNIKTFSAYAVIVTMLMGAMPVGHAAAADGEGNFINELKAATASATTLGQQAAEKGYQDGMKADLSSYKAKMLEAARNGSRSTLVKVKEPPFDKFEIEYWMNFAKAVSERLGVQTELRFYTSDKVVLNFDWHK